MSIKAWLRALSAVGTVTEVSRIFRGGKVDSTRETTGGEPIGARLEARLIGIVAAALKEVFDRDRDRFNFERGHLDAERDRAEAQLRLKWLRRSGEQVLDQLRMFAVISLAIWIVSVLMLAWLSGSVEVVSKVLFGIGWAALIGALACTFLVHSSVTLWLADVYAMRLPQADLPKTVSRTILPWLLILGLTLTAGGMVTAL